jgi:hypothetical protein
VRLAFGKRGAFVCHGPRLLIFSFAVTPLAAKVTVGRGFSRDIIRSTRPASAAELRALKVRGMIGATTSTQWKKPATIAAADGLFRPYNLVRTEVRISMLRRILHSPNLATR